MCNIMVLPQCFLLLYLRHISLITKTSGLLELILVFHVLLPDCAISIDSCTSINKFYSFINFSLQINAVN